MRLSYIWSNFGNILWVLEKNLYVYSAFWGLGATNMSIRSIPLQAALWDGTWVLLLGKEPLHTPFQGLCVGDMQFCDAACHMVCLPTKSAAPKPATAVGVLTMGSDVSLAPTCLVHPYTTHCCWNHAHTWACWQWGSYRGPTHHPMCTNSGLWG